MKSGIISYGEAFIDYISKDSSNHEFEAYLGGTTVNVAVGVRKLGVLAFYVCKLGKDEVSQFVKRELKREDVNVEYCMESEDKQICKVYVHLDENKDRYFHSYVNETPNDQLMAQELTEELFMKAAIFYCGSGTLFQETAQQTTEAAIALAKKHETLVAFDANIRLKRWESERECRETICNIIPKVDILKLAQEELLFLMEASTLEESLQRLALYKIPYVWITLGEMGAIAIQNNKVLKIEGEKINPIDTTGAGDAFMAGILHRIHTSGLPIEIADLAEYTRYGNKLGALASTKVGAFTALSTEEIQALKG